MPRGATAIVLLTGLLTAAAADPAWLREHTRLYIPADQTADRPVAWLGAVRCEPLPFRRDSIAVTPAGAIVDVDQPRFVPGRVGDAILFESGDYWNHSRGTANWLPPSVALADDPAAWGTEGAVALSTVADGRVGDHALRATFGGGGVMAARVLSPPLSLRYLDQDQIASLFCRAAPGAEAEVRLTVLSPSLRFVAQSEGLTLGSEWRRVSVRFKLPDKAAPDDLRLVLTSDRGGAVDFDAAMVEQAATHYSDRRDASSWVPGLTARGIETVSWPLWPETLNPSAGSLLLWVRPLPQTANRTFLAIGSGWTMPWRLSADGQFRASAEIGATKLSLGSLSPEVWTHLALVWSEGEARTYRDGQPVDRRPYDPALLPTWDAMLAGRYHLGIGHDHIGAFARSLAANAALDEVLLADAAIDDGALLELVTQPERMPAAFSGSAVDLAGLRRASGREETEVTLPVRVIGAPKAIEIGLDGERIASLNAPAPDQEALLRLPVASLAEGRHELTLAVLDQAGAPAARFSFWVGPPKRWDRFQVVGWNVPAAHYETFRALGGTVVNSQPDPPAAVQAVSAGLYGMWHYHNKAEPALDAALDSWVTQPDGSRGPVALARPEVRARPLLAAAAAADLTRPYPHLKLAMLNTEWHAAMDFSPAAIVAAKAATGLDLTWWPLAESILRAYSPQEIEAAEAGQGDPTPPTILRPMNLLDSTHLPAEHQPVDGAIAPDNPLYRYNLWWHRTGALASWNDALAREFRAANPGIEPLFDPMLRGPTARVYRSQGYAQEWVYVENPLRMIPVQELLATISLDRGMKPTGMPQFLFKAGTAAPISVTPPKDMMIEATWLACSRPTAMMTYWGWQLVFGPGDMWTPEQAETYFGELDWDGVVAKLKADPPKPAPHLWHPGALEAFGELGTTLFEPFGELLRHWANQPRRLAVVKSLASETFHSERWWTAFVWNPAAEAVTATGLPYDVLYDEDLTPERLAVYDAVVLTAVEVLPQPALAAVRGFAANHGLVLAAPSYQPVVPGSVGLPEWTPSALREALAARSETLAPLPAPAEAVINLLELDQTPFAVVVNDRREPGPLLGRWGKVAEQGVAQTVTVGLPDAAVWYDLTRQERVVPDGEGRLSVDLPPAGGRILGGYRQPLETMAIEGTREGTALRVAVTLSGPEGRPFEGPVPVTIVASNGDHQVRSGGRLARDGRVDETLLLPAGVDGVWQVTATEPLTGSSQRWDGRQEGGPG